MKIRVKRFLATALVIVMLLSAAPIGGLNCGNTPFAAKASAMEVEGKSYDYMKNYIEVLGNSQEDEDVTFLSYYVGKFEDYKMYANLAYDRVENHVEIYSEFEIEDNVYVWGNLVIGKDDQNYTFYMGCSDADNPIYSAESIIDPLKYDPENYDGDIEILISPSEDYDYDEVYEMLNSAMVLSIYGMEYVLETYADIGLANFGFNCFEYCPYIEDIELYGLYRNNYEWNYYDNNKINTEYVGTAWNAFGTWYVADGRIDFDYTGIFEDDLMDYVVINGKVPEEEEALIKVDGVWYYTIYGTIDYDFEGLAKNQYGWWYVRNGEIDYDYIGLAKNQYGWWYVKDACIDFKYSGMAKNSYGWWYVKNGKLDRSYTGLAKNDYGWWYFTNGSIDYAFDGLAKNQYGWWYIKNGTINYKFKGLAKNQYGWWYVKNGTIDFSYNGRASNKYGTWKVVNGKVVSK